jgi:hypothetical protein
MNDDGALVPSLDPLMPEDVQQTFESQQAPLEQADAELAVLSSVPGFIRVQAKMQKYIDDFHSGAAIGITPQMTVHDVGEKYLVASGVATVLQDILGDVTRAQQSIAAREEANAARQQGTT